MTGKGGRDPRQSCLPKNRNIPQTLAGFCFFPSCPSGAAHSSGTIFDPENLRDQKKARGKKVNNETTMAGNAGSQRIIPLEEGWNDEIKAKVRRRNEPNRTEPNRQLAVVDVRAVCLVGDGRHDPRHPMGLFVLTGKWTSRKTSAHPAAVPFPNAGERCSN